MYVFIVFFMISSWLRNWFREKSLPPSKSSSGSIEKYAKVKKSCPFCRKIFNSMAPNISLQNLVKAAHEKKEDYVE